MVLKVLKPFGVSEDLLEQPIIARQGFPLGVKFVEDDSDSSVYLQLPTLTVQCNVSRIPPPCHH